MVTRSDIESASHRIAGRVRITPVLEEPEAVLKLELLQRGGSFKARGAFNGALSAPIPGSGLIAASGGNHGIAVAHVAAVLGTRAEIFVPEVCSAAKIRNLELLGAEVTVVGAIYNDSLVAAEARAAETDALHLFAYQSPEVIAGQGTTAREFESQCGGYDTVLVAVGGGGLIGGFAAWHGDAVRIVGVEPESSQCWHAAHRSGGPVEVSVGGVASDSLGAHTIGELAYEHLVAAGAASVLVTDEQIRSAQLEIWNRYRLIAEPGGATAAAALFSGSYVPRPDERVGVLICGSNADPAGEPWSSGPGGTASRTRP
jgi:threonine dehydratase